MSDVVDRLERLLSDYANYPDVNQAHTAWREAMSLNPSISNVTVFMVRPGSVLNIEQFSEEDMRRVGWVRLPTGDEEE